MEYEIKDFVSTERKFDLIDLTLQEATVAGIVNPMLLDVLFTVNSIMVFTDLEFFPEEKEDKLALYDTLVENGVVESFLTQMDEREEWEVLQEYLFEWKDEYQAYSTSFKAYLEEIKLFFGAIVDQTSKSLDGVDLQKLQEVMSVATALGAVPGASIPVE